jgi:hypothetical protein
MSEHKPPQLRPALYSKDGSSADAQRTGNDEQQGWDAYRKWLSRVGPKVTTERAPLDHSIYSWRGYHTWADKVRQNWKDN